MKNLIILGLLIIIAFSGNKEEAQENLEVIEVSAAEVRAFLNQ